MVNHNVRLSAIERQLAHKFKQIFEMNTETIYARLTPIFHEVFDDADIIPHSNMTANDVPAWDSLSNIRLVVAVEEEFGIQFSTGEVASLSNVGEFVSVIQQRLNE